MNYQNISLNRLQQIEDERKQTALNPAFQAWMKQLKVGRLCVDREGIIRANGMMENWNFSHLKQTR
jgi:hypothetical protein